MSLCLHCSGPAEALTGAVSIHALGAVAEASNVGASDRLIFVCPSQNLDANRIVRKRTKPK